MVRQSCSANPCKYLHNYCKKNYVKFLQKKEREKNTRGHECLGHKCSVFATLKPIFF